MGIKNELWIFYENFSDLYLVKLEIFEWIQSLRWHLQGNWAGRNFVTASRVNSWLITDARTLKSTTTKQRMINFWIINSLMASIRNPSAYRFGNAHVSSGKLCAGVAKIWLFGHHSVCSLIQPKLFASFRSTSSRKSWAASVLELIKFS